MPLSPSPIRPRPEVDAIGPLLLFLARTGARVSEAVGVNANDLHLQRGRRAGAASRQGAARSCRSHSAGSGAITDGAS